MSAATPHTLTVIPENLPDELKTGRRFVAWRWEWRPDGKGGGKWTKPPVSAITGNLADITNPADLTDFETTLDFATAHNLPGVGIVMNGSDLTAIDLDHCFNNAGELTPEAAAIVELFDTHTERSPSKGLRLFVRGQLPPGRRKRGNVEAYDRDRYVTLTGQIYGEPRPIAERQTELNEWHATALEKQPRGERRERPPERTSGRQSAGSLSDDEILVRVNPERYTADPRYPSDSERDLAFTTHAAYYAGPGNAAQVESVWRVSGLWRSKCEREDYVARTIATALDRDTFYGLENWRGSPPPVSGGSAAAADDVVCITVAELEDLRAAATELEDLRALTSWAGQIRRNKGLRGSKDVAAALVFDLAALPADEDGFHRISYAGLGDQAGVSHDTVARDLKKYAKAGLVDRETRPFVHERAHPETGELIKVTERRVFVRPAGGMTALELAEQFAAADLREIRKTNPRPCPVCKADAGTTVHHTEICNACNATVDTRKTERKPVSDQTAERKTQVAFYDSLPPAVVVRSIRTQLASYAADAPQDDASPAAPDRKPQHAAHAAGGLVDLARNTSPGDGAGWFERENERQRWLENSVAVGGD